MAGASVPQTEPDPSARSTSSQMRVRTPALIVAANAGADFT